MFEVPTHQRVDLCDGRHRDVLGVGEHVRCENSVREIASGQFIGFRRETNSLDVRLSNPDQHVAYSLWRRFELAQRQFRKNEREVAAKASIYRRE